MMRFSLLSLCALRPARGFAAAALRRPRAAPRVARFSVSGAVWEARGASAPVVELYTKEGCTLCDEAKAVLASCRDDADHALTAVDITDPDKKRWLAKYKRGPGAGGSSRPTAFARAQVRHPGPARRRAVLDEAPRHGRGGRRRHRRGRRGRLRAAPRPARRVPRGGLALVRARSTSSRAPSRRGRPGASRAEVERASRPGVPRGRLAGAARGGYRGPRPSCRRRRRCRRRRSTSARSPRPWSRARAWPRAASPRRGSTTRRPTSRS